LSLFKVVWLRNRNIYELFRLKIKKAIHIKEIEFYQ